MKRGFCTEERKVRKAGAEVTFGFAAFAIFCEDCPETWVFDPYFICGEEVFSQCEDFARS